MDSHSLLQGGGDLPPEEDPGIEPVSPALAGGFFTVWATKEAHLLALTDDELDEQAASK